MSLASRLRHTVTIERNTTTIDGGEDVRDAYGVKVGAWVELAEVRAWIQPMPRRLARSNEQEDATGGGAVVADHLILMLPTDVREADRVVHGSRVYSITGVRDAAGKSHHLELDAYRVTPLSAAVAG